MRKVRVQSLRLEFERISFAVRDRHRCLLSLSACKGCGNGCAYFASPSQSAGVVLIKSYALIRANCVLQT